MQDEQLFAAHSIDSCPSHFLDVAISCVAFASPFPDSVATASLVAARNFSNRTSDVSSQARIMFSQPIDQSREPSVATPFDLSPIAAAGAPFTAETGMYIYIYLYVREPMCARTKLAIATSSQTRELTHVESYTLAPTSLNYRGAGGLSWLSLSLTTVRSYHTHECVYTCSRAGFARRFAHGFNSRESISVMSEFGKRAEEQRRKNKEENNCRLSAQFVKNENIITSLRRQRSELNFISSLISSEFDVINSCNI
ncbi:hypothetical protein ALC62_13578 [Cyphomyrmex costatus]|uniref:Uncharacterized protein n=1 Tax=Cyphomyrmex costatus TaxID=456900 RepID=A0A151I9L3_9HYME|nr:hypothetical protein ALC62_13578 [Cyphomyrmex costatus]